MPTAEIIAIGTELLLGEIQDTNTRFLALRLREEGIDLFRATLVGDNAVRISQAIREALGRSDIVITTGGLGPTVDDPTRLAVALAVDVETEYHPELWGQIQNRFQRFNRVATENNKRQAYIPKGAIPVENPVGTAPAFIVETGNKVIVSVPGVPKEMEYLIEKRVMPYLKDHFSLHQIIKASVLHTSGVGESQVDEWIGDLETLTNPTVGLLAHPGQIDIRITVKADSNELADQMIAGVAGQIYQRLGENIFGRDAQTLEKIVEGQLKACGWRLALGEFGMLSELSQRLNAVIKNIPALIETEPVTLLELTARLQSLMLDQNCQVGLGASYQKGSEKQVVIIVVITPLRVYDAVRSYGGPPQQGLLYSVNTAIDFLRRNLPIS